MQLRERQTWTVHESASEGRSYAAGSATPEPSPPPPPAPAAEVSMRSRILATHGSQPMFLVNASLAGVCGALSSVVGKLAVESARVPLLVRSGGLYLKLDVATLEMVEAVVPWLVRIFFFLMNALLTATMWRFYLKALSQGPTPVCQILNTGMNFVVSALAGLVFFAEEVTPMWAAGALSIILGLALVVSDPKVGA